MYKPTDFGYRISFMRNTLTPSVPLDRGDYLAVCDAVSALGRAYAPGQDCAVVVGRDDGRHDVLFWDSKANTRSIVSVCPAFKIGTVQLGGPRTLMNWANEVSYHGRIGPWQRHSDNRWFDSMAAVSVNDDHILVRNDTMLPKDYFRTDWATLRLRSLAPR